MVIQCLPGETKPQPRDNEHKVPQSWATHGEARGEVCPVSGAHDLPSWSVMGGAPNKGVGLGVQEGTWAQRGALKSPVKPGGLSPWGREPPPLPERGTGPGAPGCLSVLLSCPDTPLCDVGDGAHWSPGKNLFPAVPPKHRVPQGLAPSAPCLSQPPGGTLQFALICPYLGATWWVGRGSPLQRHPRHPGSLSRSAHGSGAAREDPGHWQRRGDMDRDTHPPRA